MADALTLDADAQAYVNTPSAPPAGASLPQAEYPSTAEYIDKPSPQEDAPQVAKNGMSQEPMSLFNDGVNQMNAHMQVAGAGFSKALAGAKLISDSAYSVEQAQQDVETKELQKAQMDIENFNHIHTYVDLLNTTRSLNWEDVGGNAYRGSIDFGGWLVEQVPMFATQVAAAQIGASAGAVLGGVAKNPELGAKIGAVATPSLLMGAMTGASNYYDMRQQGVDAEHAKAHAILTGSTAVITSAATFVTAAKLLPGVANTFLKSQGFKETAGALAQRLAVAFGINESAQTIQAGMTEWADFLALSTVGKFDPKAENEKFWESLKQGAAATLLLEGGLTAIGVHSGMTAVRQKIKAETARINFERAEAARKANEAQTQQTAETKRQAEVAEVTGEAQAQASKQSGMFDADHKSANVQAAQYAVEVAEAKHDVAPKEEHHRTLLEVSISKAKLQQAKFNAKVKALSKAYNDPNLVGNLTQDKRMLVDRIETFNDELAQATTQAEKDHWEAAIKRAKKELQDVKDLLDLGGEDRIKASVQAKKTSLEKAGQNTKKQIARAVLDHRMSERAEQIKTLKGKTHEDFVEDDLEAVLKQNKISNLESDQETDAFMRAQIDDKTSTLKLEDAVDDTLGKPATRVRTLVGIAKEIVERASNRAEKETRNQIEGAQKLLEGAVRASRISKEAKDHLVSKIKAYSFDKSKDEFFKLVTEVNAALDKESHDRAVSFVTKLVGKIGENMKVRTKKAGTIEKLMYLKQFANDPLTAYKFAIDFINSVKPHTEADLARWDMAQMFLGGDKLKEFDLADLKRIAMTVIELNKEGESKSLARSQELHGEIDKAVKEFHTAMQAKGKGEDRLAAQDKALGKIKKALQTPAEVYSNHMIDNIYTNNVAMTQFGEVSDMSHVLDFNAAFDKYHADNRTYLNKLKDSIKNSGVTLKQFAKILMESDKKAGVHTYDWKDPVTKKVERDLELITNKPSALAGKAGKRQELTWGQMLDAAFKMSDKEESITARFKGGVDDQGNAYGNRFSYEGEVGLGKSTQEVIEAALDDKFGNSWRNLRTGIQDFYQEFHPVVEDLAGLLYGRKLERNPTYAGPAYAPRPDAVFGDAELTRRTTLIAGSTFGRETSKQPVVLDHFWHQAVGHIRNNTRTRALYKISRIAHAVYHDPTIVDFVESHIGKKTKENMQSFVQRTLLGQKRAEGPLDDMMRSVMTRFYATSLGLNPGQFGSQITGVFNIFRKVNPVDAYRGWSVYMADPKAARELMYGGKLNERFEQGGRGRDRDIGDSERLMGAVYLGDKTAVELSFPVFWEEYSRTGDLEKARTNFARFIDETQSTGNADMLPPVFTAGPLEKVYTAMASESVMQANTVRQQWIKYRSTGKGGAEFLWTLTAINVAANAYVWAKYAAAFPYMNDKERENNFMANLYTLPFQAAASLPAIGGIISSMQIHTFNTIFNTKTKAWEVHSMTVDPFTMIDKAQTTFFDSLAKGEDTGMRAFNAAVGLLGFGLGWPVLRHVKSAENVTGVR